MQIAESQIEDILVNSAYLLQRTLRLDEEPRLLTRQMILPSGRLDLLLTYKTNLLLVELKVVGFHKAFLKQIERYKKDLLESQAQGRLLRGEICPYLLCPSLTNTQKKESEALGVTLLEYNPQEILEFYFANLRPIAHFLEIKPIDIGIWNIHLINDFIYDLEEICSVKKLRSRTVNSPKTLYNKIRFANELKLVEWRANEDEIRLSSLGKAYVELKDDLFPSRLSEKQINLLRSFIVRNPYDSHVIVGISSIVEATFALSKNSYPVPMSHLIEYFAYHAGKLFDWKSQKAKQSGTRMYSNYAVELGLLGKSENSIYLTPAGFRFTLQLQLHKSIKMADDV